MSFDFCRAQKRGGKECVHQGAFEGTLACGCAHTHRDVEQEYWEDQ